jgi:hypothetical protein
MRVRIILARLAALKSQNKAIGDVSPLLGGRDQIAP